MTITAEMCICFFFSELYMWISLYLFVSILGLN